MSEYNVKLLVGGIMIAAHFLLMILIVSLYMVHGLAFTEMTTTIGLIGPLFAGYTSVIFAFVIKHKNRMDLGNERVNLAYAVTSSFVPIIFVVALFIAVICKAWNIGFSDFENFKVTIGVIQGAFGVYVGQFIYSMFEAAKPAGTGLAPTPAAPIVSS
jgi:hypothetical protein